MSNPPPPPFAPPPSGSWWPLPPERPPVRWGLPDVLIVWLVGAVASAFVAIPWTRVRSDGSVKLTGAAIVAALVAQNLLWIGGLAVMARWKGRGSLRTDFGLSPPGLRAIRWFFAGFGLAILVDVALLAPLQHLAGNKEQAVADAIQHAHGLTFVMFSLGVVFLAPIAEELIFRGILLRALQRRMPIVWAVLLDGLIFGLAHVLGDTSVGSLVALPALVGLGVLNGVLAVRSGNLGRSILVHAGFNALAVLSIIVSRTH